MSTDVGNQCQLAADHSLTDHEVAMRMSPLTFVAIIAGILILVAIYTVIIAFVGYKCGFRIVRCLTPMKAPTGNVKGKMTMTSVTYTSLRNSKHPRFFFSDQIEGCWEYACWSGGFWGNNCRHIFEQRWGILPCVSHARGDRGEVTWGLSFTSILKPPNDFLIWQTEFECLNHRKMRLLV